MSELILYLIPVLIGAVFFRLYGKKVRKKRTALLNATAQNAGWIEASNESASLLETLCDFRLVRRGTRTSITNVFIVKDKHRFFHLIHGSMTNNVSYHNLVLLCSIGTQAEFNVCLKRHNSVRVTPENYTDLNSEQIESLNTQYKIESRTSDSALVLELLSPESIVMFEALGVEDKRPEMEVRGQYLLISRPQIKEESSETIEQFVRLAEDLQKRFVNTISYNEK